MIPLFLRELEQIFGWLLAASWQAAILAILVLFLQLVLRGRLNPRWRYALWLLVVIRLLLPLEPESALSLFQFAPQPSPALAPVTQPLFAQAPVVPDIHADHPKVSPSVYSFSLFSLLAIIWLTGVIALFLLTWQVNQRFMRQIATSPEVDEAGLLHLFAEAKAELGIRRSIRLIENAHLQSPAIMGLFRPTLLLPANVREKFDATELRLIFLHELAHLKRGDIVVQGLIALLQILHWFNPVLWFAFRRMRADREPATDALVLSRAGEAEKERYGLMLIKLLEHFNQRHSLPTLVGILEDKDQFKRRFSLIAKFTRGAYGWSLLGVAVLCLLAAVCLTKAKSNASSASISATNDTQQLVEAVRKDDVVAMQKLMAGVDPNKVEYENEPLLFWVKSPEAARLLIEHGADPNIRNKRNGHALSHLCRNGGKNTAAIVQVLLEHGADPNASDEENGETPLMSANDGKTFDLLLAHGADLNAKLKTGEGLMDLTPSHPPEYFQALLGHGVAFDPKKDGPNLMLHSAWISNIPLMQELIDRGVDPNTEGVWAKEDKSGKPMMMLPMKAAVVDGQFKAAKFLLEHGAKADDCMNDALTNRQKKILQFFWDQGVRGISELTYKVSQGAPVSDLQKLLDQGVPVDPPPDKIYSPLAIAAQLGNLDAVKMLIARGADVNRGGAPNPQFPIYVQSPLAMAASEGQDEVVAYLLAHGAKPNPGALWQAAENSYPYSEQLTRDHFEKTVRLLIDAGAAKNATPEEQGYILSAPIQTRQGPPNAAVLKLLLDAGISPEVPMPYIVDNGEKPNSVIGYFRDYYQKYKDDPAYDQEATTIKPQLDMLEVADKGASSHSTVTISGKIRFVHPELIDLEKSVGYLAPVSGVAEEFHFQPDGSYTLPYVEPAVYNRRIHLVRKEAGPLPPEAVDMDLSPILIDGSSPNLTMNLNLDVPFKNVAKGLIQVGIKVVEINDDVYLANKAGIDAAVEKSDFDFLNHLKGVSLLSTPRVSTTAGQKASIEIVRKFHFPSSFDNAKVIPAINGQTNPTVYLPPLPREFISKNIGITSEITPSLDQGKINVSGKFNVTNFTGFIPGSQGSRTPSFQTTESYFEEALDDSQEKGLWIPGVHGDELSKGKRLVLFLSAKLMQ